MQLANRVHRRRQLLAVVAISALVGVLAAGVNTGRVSLWPPGLKPAQLGVATAATQVFVDAGTPSMILRRDYVARAQTERAEFLGRVLTSPPLLDRIARRAGLPPDQVAGGAASTVDVPWALSEPASEQRASDILRSSKPYQLEVQARQTTPVLDIYTQAPSVDEARRLADAAVQALEDHLRGLVSAQGLGEREREGELVRLRQLGPARGSVVNGGAPIAIAVLTFLVAFALSCAALMLLLRLWVRAAPRRALRPEPRGLDDWPRTTRVLPWMFAGFLAILWLVPFNDIELAVSLPIDLKFDRLVLPFVAVTWALALAVGGNVAPRLRRTWIHAGVAAFVACAFLSVVLAAPYLNRTLELDGSLKALPLLVAYVSLFIIAASAVRASEIHAFLTYSLVLAVACAAGVIWEYRFKQNLFFDWSDKLLPGIFSVEKIDTAGAVDDIGRRMVRGPAALPLEAVAMLSMSLPIALVWLMHAKRARERVLYGLAACLLLAAMFATYRKSALLAPVSVIATLAYFRRRELLKLAPLALVLVLLVHVLAPGAIGKTTSQFDPSKLGVTTVSDRSADYDAVRPDLWTHLAFGRGWGSYDHDTYRILDSELLHRTIEMGLVGLLAFMFMVLAVVAAARKTINSRDPDLAPLALVGAAAAISFGVVSTLFDVLSFPHATYIFLYMAGLTAAAIDRSRQQARLFTVRSSSLSARREPEPQRVPTRRAA